MTNPIYKRFIIFFLLSCFLISFPLQGQDSFVIKAIDYQLTLHQLTDKDVYQMLPFQKGDRVSLDQLNKVQEQLLSSQIFKHVELKMGSYGRLKAVLVESQLIRKIKVQGAYPYSAKKVIRLSTLRAGDAFDKKNIDESYKRVSQFFYNDGYPDVDVSITPKVDELNSRFVNILITIKRHRSKRLGRIEFVGNHFFKREYLFNKIRGLSHYKPKKLKKRLKKIKQLYIKAGFVRARVKLAQATLNKKTGHIDIKIEISERKRIKLQFEGNKFFKDKTLDDYVTFFNERGYDRFAVERSVERIRDFYYLNGFSEAKITSKTSKDSQTVFVTYFVFEGKRTRIKKISFKGNKYFKKKILLQTLTSHQHSLVQQGFFQEKLLPKDLQGLTRFYKNNGFLEFKINSIDVQLNRFKDQAHIIIYIDEGPAYKIAALQFKCPDINAKNLTKDKCQKYLLGKSRLKVGKRIRELKVNEAKDRLLDLYYLKGHAYTQIDISRRVDVLGKQVFLTFKISPGPLTRFGHISIHGEYFTKKHVIKDLLKFKKGDVYSYKKILEAQVSLKKLGVFDHVRLIPLGLHQKKSQIDILVKVQEAKTLTVDLQAGFDSDKLGSGQLVLTKRNLFGYAKQLQYRAIAGFEFSRSDVTYYSPKVFGATWNLVNQYFVEYEDDEKFNAASFGGSIGVLKNFGPRWSVVLKNSLVRQNIFEDQSNQAELADNLFDNTLVEFLASVSYDRRDNFADPTKGFYVLLSSEFDSDLTDIDNNFNITQLSFSHYFSFWKKFVFVNVVRVGLVEKLNASAEIPVNKLFFLGGNDTMRGFDEDDLLTSGGTRFLLHNFETHFRVSDSIKLAGFLDSGVLTSDFSNVDRSSIRHTAGFGIRYITPIGPIRVDYGFILDKGPNQDGQRFHFSFGHFF